MSDPALQASNPAASAWVSANAGSGKTYVLTSRVIRLLLDGTPPSRLLCLTYTRAAAAEMRARVFQELGDWALADDATLARRIEEREGAVPDAARMAQARRLFATALETPGGLKIQTIHAFCERLVGRFPAEANVPVPFEVLTDADAASLKRAARIDALSAMDDAEATDAMRRLAPYVDARDFAALFEGQSSKLLSGMSRDAWQVLGLPAGLTPEDVIADGGFERESVRALYVQAADIFSRGSKTDESFAARVRDALSASGTPEELFDAFTSVFFTQAGTRTKTIGTKGLRGANGGFFLAFDSEIERASSLAEHRKAAEAALIVSTARIVGEKVAAAYAARKRARGVLDFNDLIDAALHLLTGPAAAWALFKLDGGLDHILIDEAQDTSPEQWAIVERIAEEFFAGRGARGASVRTLFVVGDEKQSIFSFQGANLDVFALKRESFRSQVTGAKGTFLTPVLNTSRRSARAVLDLVDAVFADEALASATSRTSWAKHEAHRKDAAGSVEIWPLVEKPPKPEAAEEANWMAPLDKVASSDPRLILADRIAARIAGWIGTETVEGKNGLRVMRAGDILILVQRRGVLSQAIIRCLKQRNIDVAGADRLGLLGHIAVKDLIAYGRTALLPQDDLNLAALLKSPFFGFDDDTLYAVAYGRTGSLWQALRASELPVARTTFATLNAAANRLGRDAPFDFYARLLSAGSGRALMLARLGAEAEDVIDEFLAAAASYEETHAPSLEGFLHWLETAGGEVKRDPDEAGGAVRVLTTHGAKGLEAPVVILPDTMATVRTQHAPFLLPHEDSAVWRPAKTAASEAALQDWTARQDAEHKRLLYVALTRPRDRLVVCGVRGQKSSSGTTWYDAILEGFKRLDGVTEIAREDGITLRYGAPPPALTESNSDALKNIVSAPPIWLRTPAPTEEAIGLVRPSRLTPDLTFDNAVDSFGLQRGRILHRLLQSLPDLAPADRPAAAARYLTARAVEWPAAIREDAAARILTILEDPRFAAAFAPGSRAEVSIAGKVSALGASGFISGQIDRLAVTADAVLIVDYKTNKNPPANAAETPAAYLRQMALYREAMRAAFPDKRVTAALLWTETPDLIDLPDSLMDTALAALVQAPGRA